MRIDVLTAVEVSEVRDLLGRVEALETGGLANSSLSRGMLRIIDDSGDTYAAVGHSGAFAGLLIPSGGALVDVQTWIIQRIAADLTVPLFRISQLESSMNNFGPRVGALEGDVAALQGANASGRLSNLEARVASLEGALPGMQAAIASLVSRLNATIDYAAGLDDSMRAYHPGKPLNPPPIKG